MRAFALFAFLLPAVSAAKPISIRRDAWKTCTATDGVDWCNLSYRIDPRPGAEAAGTTTLHDGRGIKVESHVFTHDTAVHYRLADVVRLDIDGDRVPETLVVVEETTGSPDEIPRRERDWAGSTAAIYVYDMRDGTPRQLGTILYPRAPIRAVSARGGVVTLRTPDGKLRWRLVADEHSRFEALP